MMRVVKQGTNCVVEVESVQRDSQDVWGHYRGNEIHLGSYQSESDAVYVLQELIQADLIQPTPYQMPQDFKKFKH